MVDKPGRRKRPRRAWPIIVGVAVVIFLIAFSLIYYYNNLPTSACNCPSIPVQIVQLNEKPPTFNLPFNETIAREYVRFLISDYDNLVDSGQKGSPNFQNVEPYLTAYPSQGGSWEVWVARENYTAPVNGIAVNRIEFLFIRQIPGVEPQIITFTNESAQFLRPVLAAPVTPGQYGLSLHPGFADDGWYLDNTTAESVYGFHYIPFVWIVNMTDVFNGDTAVNANSAALAIYNANLYDMNYQLNPPFPTWGWFQHMGQYLWDSAVFWVFIVIAGGAGILSFIWQAQTRRRGQSG